MIFANTNRAFGLVSPLAGAVLLSIATGCGSSSSSQWNAESAASLRTVPPAILADIDSGRLSDILSRMDDDAIVLDLDENNRAVRFDGRDKIRGYFESLGEAMKAQGLKLKSTVTRNEC